MAHAAARSAEHRQAGLVQCVLMQFRPDWVWVAAMDAFCGEFRGRVPVEKGGTPYSFAADLRTLEGKEQWHAVNYRPPAAALGGGRGRGQPSPSQLAASTFGHRVRQQQLLRLLF